ncbi:hypothetical protein HN51_022916 [Arachis hypogaea]
MVMVLLLYFPSTKAKFMAIRRASLDVIFVEAEEIEVLAGRGFGNQQELFQRVAERIQGEVVEEQKIDREVVEELGSSFLLVTNKRRGETI